MSKLLSLALLLTISLVGIAGYKTATTLSRNAVTTETEKTVKPSPVIPKLKDLLTEDLSAPATVQRTINLEAKNTVLLRGPVTGASVGKVMKELTDISQSLGKNDKIYLVLDTPGGSVTDGADLIDFMEALPQKVTTVTLFAASMGFQIAENNPGERLIIRNGTLMSHRATLGGLDGQLDGEFETRYRTIKRQVDHLETVDSVRMGLTLTEYKAKIKDELWVYGFDALDQKVADAEVLVTCGSTMVGTEEVSIDTMFGPVNVVFDKCPLIKHPLSIELKNVRQDARNYVYAIIYDLFYSKEKFVKQVIVPNKFNTIFQ